MAIPFKRVLAIGAHVDDVEFCCGGLVHRLNEEGAEVHVFVLSFCEESLPEEFDAMQIRLEWFAAMEKLKVPAAHLHSLEEEYRVRTFPDYRQQILDEIIDVAKHMGAFDLVLCPSMGDLHQDHYTVAMETFRWFKDKSTVWAYDNIRNHRVKANQVYVELKMEDVLAKFDAVKCYRSQRHRHIELDWVSALAQVRGREGGFRYAEAYEVVRHLLPVTV